MKKIVVLFEYLRPFTLLMPAVGFASGGLVAAGRFRAPLNGALLVRLALGAVGAMLLNGAANGLNQYYDVDIDRINKPKRPLPSERLSASEALRLTVFLYALSFALSWLVSPITFLLFASAALGTYIYSAPPIRTKRRPFLANVTISIPRGMLLKVAGWSSVASVGCLEPWYIGLISGLFLIGAVTTKDFSDIEGDRRHDCLTLPVKYGVRKSALIMSPFLVLPWLMMPLGARVCLLMGDAALLTILGLVLAMWGGYTASLILQRPEALAETENHPSWRHMYFMMMAGQLGLVMAYMR